MCTYGKYFEMAIFRENKCRFCKKISCCVKCRKKHEELAHNVNLNCGICSNGKIIIKNPTEELLVHIKQHHWPLHCVNCYKIFESIGELILHEKCVFNKKLHDENAIKTPARPNIIIDDNDDSNYESPPIMYPFGKNIDGVFTIPSTSNVLSLTTSTPMQGDQETIFLKNISQPITPVDSTSKVIGEASSETNLNQPKELSINRRVTFMDTPKVEENTNESEVNSNETENIESKETKAGKTSKINDTVWETAISDTPECSKKNKFIKPKSSINQAEQLDNSKQIKYETQVHRDDLNEANPHSYIWSSMTNLVKNIMSGLSSISSQTKTEEEIHVTPEQTSHKRLRSESEIFEDLRRLKKMKFTDLKCRKPINSCVPYKFCQEKNILGTCDKSTQTD